MDGNCFCEWDQPTTNAPKPVEDEGDPWFPNAAPKFKEQRSEERRKSNEFKEKLKSINFTRVSGGGRA